MGTVVNLFCYFILVVIALIFILGAVCMVHFIRDPYGMNSALEDFENKCTKCNDHLRIAKEILAKMNNCPPISPSNRPVVASKLNDNLYILIVGNSKGEPRLFAYDRTRDDYYSETVNKIEKSKKFKRKGISHSIDKNGLANLIERASKANYKLELEREQQAKFNKHFKISDY